MGRYYSWLNTAVTILKQYKGAQPFAAFLKSFFAANKKYGSKDRKQISHLCYCYFRLGKMLPPNPGEDAVVQFNILAGLFLCSQEANDLLTALQPKWAAAITAAPSQKLELINADAAATLPPLTQIFPWQQALSEGMDAESFSESFLSQPNLFLRIRPGFETRVKDQFQESDLQHQSISNQSVALPNQTKLEELLHLNRQVVIQDYSSQQTAQLLQLVPAKPNIKVWDCCAASGGKSILAADTLGSMELTVSDIRESILSNCKNRLAEAGIKIQHAFTADLTNPASIKAKGTFDLLICDAPCSGSGTWARTPEQLFYFEEERIAHFQSLQQQMVRNVIPYIKKEGYLLYITCSVFRQENEAVARFAEMQGLEMLKMQLFKGWPLKADSMFAALFRKP